MNKSELIKLLLHFGFHQEFVKGRHSLFIHDKKDSLITLAPMNSNRIVPDYTISSVITTFIYKNIASQDEIDEYLHRLKKKKKLNRKNPFS